jgi:phosphate transport system substrate-binding protein
MRTCAALVVLALIVAACGGVAAPRDPFAGEYIAAAAESAVPIAERLTAAFASRHAGVKWTVKDVGSSAAIALVNGGEADAAFLSREPTVEDRTQVQTLGLGFSAQVLVVHPSNPVTGLSRDQLRGIFNGAIKDWSEVGGVPGAILVVLRSAGSPTLVALEPLLRTPGVAYRSDAVMTQDANSMLTVVSSSPRAIGIVSALHLDGRANAPRPIAADGAVPSKANVASGVYAYRRMITLALPLNTSLVRPGAKEFLDFVHGEQGQRVLAELF